MPQSQNGNPSGNHPSVLPAEAVQQSFVRLDQHIPDILIDLKYASQDNFIGAVVDGYQQTRALLSRPAAEALANVSAVQKTSAPKTAFIPHWKNHNCLNRVICSAIPRTRAAVPLT